MFGKIITYFREVRAELKQVNWPKREDTVRSTLVVIGLSLAVALFLGLADLGFSRVVGKLLEI
jgi:preprotein translocase subunit SecE